ncbi:MAG: glycoside hydrolase family 15 protein [Acetobacteraceae bacterium]
MSSRCDIRPLLADVDGTLVTRDKMPLPAASVSGTSTPDLRDRISEPLGHAPGHPGIAPTWTSSAKDMVGCTLGPSRVWFTLGFGIVNEVYYPRVDTPQIRDLGFIVGDGRGFWVEVKRLENYSLRLLAPATPACEIVHAHERFILTLRIALDPDRDVLAVEVQLIGHAELKPYVLIAPRLGTSGQDNTAEIRRYGTRRVLAAEQGPFGLALAAVDDAQQDAFGPASAGYVGESDGWQDFHRNGALTWQYASAGPGNVALIGALPRKAALALGFGSSMQAAATLAVSSLMQPFDNILERQIEAWRPWHLRCKERLQPDESIELANQFVLSSMVLRTHRDKTYPGTMVASLSVPWGNSRDDRGGYHLVWPRDLVQCATALLALGAEQEARNTLRYLIATQKQDGSWYQNQWLGGTPYWKGLQLDETAFPVLLAASMAEREALDGIAVTDLILRALCFIATTGPSSPQDRWEENAGINTFTLSVCIAALVAGAPFLPQPAKDFALMLADFWNAQVESWTAVRGTPLARRLGVESYYIRVAPPDVLRDPASLQSILYIQNRSRTEGVPADEEISIDFLQLVRFGLRGANDPRIRDSITVVDALLKTDTPNGPAWHRYNGDGYGEHDDGRPFDGTGRGRAWPLLTGERGHYELVAGNDPSPYLKAMAAMTSPGGMMPEQVWDSTALPERRLFPGRPTGSAMPLAWAHAEFIKLMISRHLGYPFDRPAAVWARYGGRCPEAKRAIWCFHAPIGRIKHGMALIIALPRTARIHWGTNGWQNVADGETQDTGLGLHGFEVGAAALSRARCIDFTFQWRDTQDWVRKDFHVAIDRGNQEEPDRHSARTESLARVEGGR